MARTRWVSGGRSAKASPEERSSERSRERPGGSPDASAGVAPGSRRRSAASAAAALIAGLAFPFAFSPFEWWPLAPLSLLVLYALIQRASPRRALLIGWLFGVGCFGVGVSWVYHSLHLFGAAVAPLAAALTALFVLVMTVFPALVAWLWARLRGPARSSTESAGGLAGGSAGGSPLGHAALGPWLFAALWALAELLRGKLVGGFPWILAGYSQTSGPLGALAPLVGVYAIGFLLVAAACLLHPLCRPDAARGERLAAASALAGIALLAALAPLYQPGAALGEPLRVRLVQANIPQEMKFSQERLTRSLDLYTDLSGERSLEGIDLVVWPETAIPTYFDRVESRLAPFVADMDARGVEVLSGGFQREGEEVWNSVRQLGGERALYKKRHLVPFGEYMPLRVVLDWFAQFIDIPMSDLARGTGPHVPLDVAGERIGVSICYEDVYGEEMRALLPASTLLVNVSNDAWFGDSFAPHQHEQKARMRAREFDRALVRVTNTGVSSAIRPDGSVIERIAHDTQGVLDVTVQPREGMTLYARTGNWPLFLLASALLVAGLVRRRAHRGE